MKKIFLALAILASVQVAVAQGMGGGAPDMRRGGPGGPGGPMPGQMGPAVNRAAVAAKSAVDAAEAVAANAKKATKVATWTKLGQAYMSAYNAAMGDGWLGASRQELDLIMRGARALGEQVVEIGGTEYTKVSYPSADYYFSRGQLSAIKVTNPVCEDALGKALNAYAKAAQVDAKGSKKKDIVKAISDINDKYIQDAYTEYTLGNASLASVLFEKAAAASATAPLSELDTMSVYNAGFTAYNAGEFDRAKQFLQKSINYKYYGNDGDAYARLADTYAKLGDVDGSKEILENGFKAFPQSQSILIGLINYYVNSGNDTDRLFELIQEAKANEPNNASLYYVEGNIHKQLGDYEGAVAAYQACATINPNYEYGYIGEGILNYEKAIEVQTAASEEMDDTKYMALVADFEKYLKGCVEPFEQAFRLSKDNDIKISIAEYLKNACYRFREDPEYQAKYDVYNKIVNEGISE